MSDRHSFLSDNFYVGSDNVQCPTVILSTEALLARMQKLGTLNLFIQKLAC